MGRAEAGTRGPAKGGSARRAAIAGVALLGLAAGAVGGVYAVSEVRLRSTPEVIGDLGALPSAPHASVERGAHIARTRGCTGCHGEDFGGQLLIDVPAFAVVAAPNLTPGRGGLPMDRNAADWDRAIRHGIGSDGRALALMPSHTYSGFSDDDTAALIAFLGSTAPVDRELPRRRFGPVGRALIAAGRLPIFAARAIDHQSDRPPAPPVAETAEFGAYLAAICSGCHGPDFAGGRIAGSPADHPAAPNLTPDRRTGLGSWSEDDFFRALREGRRPDGSGISARHMPWEATARMTDVEIRALWLYFSSLPARESDGA